MVYKKVARIEEKISAIGVGCWGFGGDWDTSNDKNAFEIIHAAVDLGVNLFDVAPVYGWTHAERLLGRALKEGGLRQKVLVASKCGLTWNEKHQTANDLSRKNILREIDESLERLQTDYIDIYQLHWPDPATPIEETAETLAEIKKAGKIRHVGLSNFAQQDVEKFMSMIEVDEQQSLYNMFERNTDSYHGIPLSYRTEREVLPNVKKWGQAFLPYSPLFQGLLAGRFLEGVRLSGKDIRLENPKFANAAVFEPYRQTALKLKAFADELGRPMNEVSLNWTRQKEEITSIISGASSVAQLERNLHCTTWNLTAEEIAHIDKIIAPFENV